MDFESFDNPNFSTRSRNSQKSSSEVICDNVIDSVLFLRRKSSRKLKIGQHFESLLRLKRTKEMVNLRQRVTLRFSKDLPFTNLHDLCMIQIQTLGSQFPPRFIRIVTSFSKPEATHIDFSPFDDPRCPDRRNERRGPFGHLAAFVHQSSRREDVGLWIEISRDDVGREDVTTVRRWIALIVGEDDVR